MRSRCAECRFGRGGPRESQGSVASFLAGAQEAEILERLVREVEVMQFEVERA